MLGAIRNQFSLTCAALSPCGRPLKLSRAAGFLLAAELALAAVSAAAQPCSELWGENGEKWTPQSRLPDFSFAGYHFGEQPIPHSPVVTDITKFGAKGDGVTDDTAAFRAAVAATPSGTVFIPQGRYLITEVIDISRSNLVLRGAGRTINFDHHRNCPYENLFSNIEIGNPRHVWDSSGRGDRGPHAGVRETFWNLRWSSGSMPDVPSWPQINYVGMTKSASEKTSLGRWIEPFPTAVSPVDLHQAQLERRLKNASPAPANPNDLGAGRSSAE